MTATRPDQTAPEQGRFDRLGLVVSLVLDPHEDPLPQVGMSGDVPTIRFADKRYGPVMSIHIQERADIHAQAAYLYALAASLNTLAREVEAQR